MKFPVVDPKSDISFLQQRLTFTTNHPSEKWCVLVDNVPEWPSGFPVLSVPDEDLADARAHYADCRGDERLREMVCARGTQSTSAHLCAENALITNGALHGLAVTLAHARSKYHKLLCQRPTFRGVTHSARKLGFRVDFIESDETNVIDLDDLRRKISPSSIVYLNTPNNPTGELISESVLAAIQDIAVQHGSLVLVDVVYEDFVFIAASQRQLPRRLDNTVFFGSMSKAFGAPGLRVGWAIAESPRIDALAAYLESQCVAVNSEAQMLAQRLLQLGNKPLVERANAHREYLAGRLQGLPFVSHVVPDGGLQYFVQVDVEDIEDFADSMLLHEHVALVTTANYEGLTGSYLRIPLGLSRTTLDVGITALERHLQVYNEGKRGLCSHTTMAA